MVTARIANDGAGSSARYVGRVGALAVALGVGFAVATSPGVAWAEPETDSTSSDAGAAPSNPDPASPAEPAEQAAESPGADPEAPETVDSGSTPDTQAEVTLGGDDGPTVVIRSSGGALQSEDEAVEEPEAAAEEPLIVVEAPTVPDPAPQTVDSSNDAPAERVTAPVAPPTPAEAQELSEPSTSRVAASDTAVPPAPFADAESFAVPMNPLLAAVDAPAPAIAPPPDPIAAILAIPATLLNTAATFVSSVIHALFIPAPGAPPDSPLVWAVLAVVRRQFNAAFNNSTPVLNPQQTSQDLDDREVHGTLGASDVDGDPLTFSVPTSGVGAPANGTVVIDSVNRTWTYTPDAGFSGSDSFTVTASDEGGFHLHGWGQEHAAIESVAVTVAADNDPAFTVDSIDQMTGVVTGHLNDVDPNPTTPVTYAVARPPDPSVGSVAVDSATGDWTFTPTGEARLDSFSRTGDQAVSFTIESTAGQTTSSVEVVAPIDPAEAAVTTVIDVGDSNPFSVGPWPSLAAVSGDRLYVVNQYNATVLVIDTTTNTIIDTDPSTPEIDSIRAGGLPTGIIARGDRLYISNYNTGSVDDNNVTVIDTTTNTVIDTNPATPAVDRIFVGDGPRGMAVSGNRLYVANELDGTVTVIDTATNTVIDTNPTTPAIDPIQVDSGPFGVAAAGDRVYVANRASGTVTVIDTTTNAVLDEIAVGSRPTGVAVAGDRLYVTNAGDGTVTVVDIASSAAVDTIEVGDEPEALVAAGERVYVVNRGDGTMSIIDSSVNTVVETVLVGEFPSGITVSANRIYVTSIEDNIISVVTSTYFAPDQPPVVTPPPPPGEPDEDTGAVTGSIGVVDPDGDPLTIVFAEGGAPKYGAVTIDPVTGTYTYTPNQAGRLRAALGLGDTDSFTVVVTQGDPAPAPFARMASFAALAAEPGFSETVTVDDIPIAGASLTVAGDPIVVGSRPAGIVVTDRYAYVLNSQDGTVTVIDIADNSVSGDPVTVGTFPALAATNGDRVYVVNALSGTVTVIDTATNTVQGSPITLAPGVSSPGLSPDGSMLFVTNAQLGVVHAVDTATGTVIDSIVVGEPPTPGQEYHVPNGGMAFSEDGTRLYITRQFAELVNGTLTTGSGDVVEIGIDPADTTTYLTVIGSPIALPGKVPAAAQIVGDRMYIGTLNVSEAGQSPDTLTEGTVVVVDVDPDSPTYRQVVDGIRVLPVPMNLAISPDESLAYTVHLGLGMVSVIDLAAGEVLLEIPFDTTPQSMGAPNLIGISPDGSRLYVTNYAENSVVALTIA